MYMYYVYDSDSSSDIYDNMLESYMPTVRIVFKIYITNNDEKEIQSTILGIYRDNVGYNSMGKCSTHMGLPQGFNICSAHGQ